VRSRFGSAVKCWTEKINEIKRSRVCSPARPGQPFFVLNRFVNIF
jgi:hypothetical protein